MPLTLLEQSNHLIDENRRRIEDLRAALAAAPADASDTALRLRVLVQMELSLACLERHRDELAARVAKRALEGQDA
ncbi:MAG: hypothetical protein ACK4TL_02405 [Hyphomicrobiaceae bacterium]